MLVLLISFGGHTLTLCIQNKNFQGCYKAFLQFLEGLNSLIYKGNNSYLMWLRRTTKTEQYILYILTTFCLTRQSVHVATVFLCRFINSLPAINYVFIEAINHGSGFTVRDMMYNLRVIWLMRNRKSFLTRTGILLAASLITLIGFHMSILHPEVLLFFLFLQPQEKEILIVF